MFLISKPLSFSLFLINFRTKLTHRSSYNFRWLGNKRVTRSCKRIRRRCKITSKRVRRRWNITSKRVRRRWNITSKRVRRRWNITSKMVRRRWNITSKRVRRRWNITSKRVRRRCNITSKRVRTASKRIRTASKRVGITFKRVLSYNRFRFLLRSFNIETKNSLLPIIHTSNQQISFKIASKTHMSLHRINWHPKLLFFPLHLSELMRLHNSPMLLSFFFIEIMYLTPLVLLTFEFGSYEVLVLKGVRKVVRSKN